MTWLIFALIVAVAFLIGRLTALEQVRRVIQRSRSASGTVLDTSALLDGRIPAMLRNNMIIKPLHVPSQVLAELRVFEKSRSRKYASQKELTKDALQFLEHEGYETDESYGDEDADQQVVSQAIDLGYELATLDKEVHEAASKMGLTVINPDRLFFSTKPTIKVGQQFEVLIHAKQGGSKAYALTQYGELIAVSSGAKYVGSRRTVELTHISKAGHRRILEAKLVD